MRRGTRAWIPITIGAVSVITSLTANLLHYPVEAKAILGIGTVLLVGLALLNARIDAGKGVATLSASIAVFLGLLLILSASDLLQRAVPLCGDEVCARGECAQECADCKPEQCLDGICQEAIESCATTLDCACVSGMVCAPLRENATERGCAPVRCGDGMCDPGETADSCCTDCRCNAGFECQNNRCLFQPPRITVLSFQLSERVSATTMAVAPSFRNATTDAQPLAAVVIKGHDATAYNISITFSIESLVRETMTFEDIAPGEERTALWYPKASQEFLTVTSERKAWINITIRYADAQGVERTTRRAMPITILGRGTPDSYGHLAFYVTPADVPIGERTPERIWEEIGERVSIGSDSPTVRFPAETLLRGRGSARDIALVLVSAYQRAGLSPALVATPTDTYVWVRSSDDYAVLDPRKIGKSFSEAQVARPGTIREVAPIAQAWQRFNATPVSLTPSLVPGALLRTQRDVSQDCDETIVRYNLRNDGLVAAPVCARSLLLLDEKVVDEKEWCVTVQAQDAADLGQRWVTPNPSACPRPRVVFTVEPDW